MSKKVTKLPERDIRRLEILEKYTDIDREKQEVTIPYHVDKASDLFVEETLGDKSSLIKTEIFERAGEFSEYIPPHYKVNIDIKIDDMEDYKVDEIGDSFKDSLELSFYKLYRVEGKSWLKMALLMLIGVAILIILNVLKASGVLGENLTDSILDYVIDTAACAFIWEACSVVFLYPSEYSIAYKKVFRSLRSVYFTDQNNKKLLTLDPEVYRHEWIDDSRSKRFGRCCLLISSCIFISIGFIQLCDFLFAKKDVVFSSQMYTALYWMLLVITIFNLFIGFSCLLRYLEISKLKVLTTICSVVLFVAVVAAIVIAIINEVNGGAINHSTYLCFGLMVVAILSYFIGLGTTKKKRNKK